MIGALYGLLRLVQSSGFMVGDFRFISAKNVVLKITAQPT